MDSQDVVHQQQQQLPMKVILCNTSCSTAASNFQLAETNQSFFTYDSEGFLLIVRDFFNKNHAFSLSEEVPIVVTFCLLSLFSVIGNSLVCWIILRKGCRQSSRNWYILNLAFSDILTSVVCNPLTVVKLVYKDWFLGEILCKITWSMQTMYVLVSAFTLVALALDRYSSITKPNHGETFKQRSVCYILLIWTLAICLAIPMMKVTKLEPTEFFNESAFYCIEKWESKHYYLAYTIVIFLLQYLSPLIAIIVLHCLIGTFLGKRLSVTSRDTLSIARKQQRHRKNIILLMSMAASFGVCWLPLHIVTGVISAHIFIEKVLQDTQLVWALCIMVGFSSVCINPIIYGVFNSNFRQDLHRVWRKESTPSKLAQYSDITRYRRSSP